MTIDEQSSTQAAGANTLQLHDARPFFEKALAYGVQHGVIGADKLAAINADAPKGMVQIARYFGSEFLRPELEKARDRMVNLISLYLLDTTEGDLHQAAISLRDHSLLSRSKGGSDMLKRLIGMPESSNFGMAGYADAETPLLAVWSLRSHADYRAELARRTQIAQAIHAAQWLAEQFDLDPDELEAAGADAEAVIRTGLLMLARGFPGWLRAQQQRTWSPVPRSQQPPDLAGRTLCVLGLGSIGAEIARLGQALGLHVIGIRRSPPTASDPVAEIHPPAALPQVLPRCQWLAIACPLTGETRRLIDAAMLARLPRGARLINVARGEIVDEAALIDAL